MRRPVRLVADVSELDVVHDDEVVEVGGSAGICRREVFEEDGSVLEEGGEVTLDADPGR